MVGTIKKVLFACKSFIIYKNQAKLTLLHNTFNNQPQEPFWNGFKTTCESQEKECERNTCNMRMDK